MQFLAILFFIITIIFYVLASRELKKPIDYVPYYKRTRETESYQKKRFKKISLYLIGGAVSTSLTGIFSLWGQLP